MDTNPWQPWSAFTAAAPSASPQDLIDRFNRLARTYVDAVTTSTPGTPPGDAAQVFGDALRDLFAPMQPPLTGTRAMDAASDRPDFLSAPPAFGAGREHQLRAQRQAAAWQRLEEAQRRLQRLWLDALRDAGEAFVARLKDHPPPAEGAAAMRALYDTWIDCAEDAYSRIAHGAPFCKAFADSVNAASHWRRELQVIARHAAALPDLPTRAELNSLHQRLRSTEERLRLVEAELRAAKAKPRRRKSP